MCPSAFLHGISKNNQRCAMKDLSKPRSRMAAKELRPPRAHVAQISQSASSSPGESTFPSQVLATTDSNLSNSNSPFHFVPPKAPPFRIFHQISLVYISPPFHHSRSAHRTLCPSSEASRTRVVPHCPRKQKILRGQQVRPFVGRTNQPEKCFPTLPILVLSPALICGTHSANRPGNSLNHE